MLRQKTIRTKGFLPLRGKILFDISIDQGVDIIFSELWIGTDKGDEEEIFTPEGDYRGFLAASDQSLESFGSFSLDVHFQRLQHPGDDIAAEHVITQHPNPIRHRRRDRNPLHQAVHDILFNKDRTFRLVLLRRKETGEDNKQCRRDGYKQKEVTPVVKGVQVLFDLKNRRIHGTRP